MADLAGTKGSESSKAKAEVDEALAELRVVGAWQGLVQLSSDVNSCTVAELRQRVASLSGIPAEDIRLICSGRTLRDTASEECSSAAPLDAASALSSGASTSLGSVTLQSASEEAQGPSGQGRNAGPSCDSRGKGQDSGSKDSSNLLTLAHFHVKRQGSKVLLSRLSGSSARGRSLGAQPSEQSPPAPLTALDQVERAQRLARIKAAAEALASRTEESSGRGRRGRGMQGLSSRGQMQQPGTGPGQERGGDGDGGIIQVDEEGSEAMHVELEDQSGRRLVFSTETDRKSLATGLLLHSRARGHMRQGDLTVALELLTMAQDAFALCDQSLLESVDNVALLLLDVAWCHFLLNDTQSVTSAFQHLARVRAHLQRSHGEDLSRLRRLQGGFQPELATYLRLHLLEGVVAFHSNNLFEAQRRFSSATILLNQLQVSDVDMAVLGSMGFDAVESRRGLRMAAGDVERAAEFVMQQREKEERKREEEMVRRQKRRLKGLYGETPSGDAVDMDTVQQLSTMLGLEVAVVAEAVRGVDNNRDKALDLLLDPFTLEAVKDSATSRARLKGRSFQADPLAKALLLSQGFSMASVDAALRYADGNVDIARQRLMSDLGALGDSQGERDFGPAVAGESALRESGEAAVGQGGSKGEETESKEHDVNDDDGSDGDGNEQDIDMEMEAEVVKDVTGDAFEEYDIDVTVEEQMLSSYKKLLALSLHE